VKELGPFGQSFNFGIEEYAASKGRLPPVRKRNDKRVVYVATIEKANGLVNSLIESNRLSSIGLIVIDELHMISDRSRGSVLEMCLIKVLLGATNYSDGIQMVGMSATISNVNCLAQFMRAQVYTNNFRPVELKEYVKLDHNIYSIDTMASIRKIQPHVNKVDPDQVSVLVSEIIPQSSCLIFCQSKKNCESVALMLTQCLPQSLMRVKYNERKSLLDVMRIETSYMCPILAKTIPYGIAYHHSGLTGDERSLIEGAYLDGTLCVITCTSTLAAGVNLPARRVIIRSPYVGRDFITVSQYRQMAGRAGRCGLCDAGDSIIIVNNKDKQKFIDVISCPPDSCNSQLLSDDRLMSLILSLIALQLLKTASDDHISKLVECSLLSYTQSVDVVELKQKCLDALHHLSLSNYIIMTSSNLMITDLGRAIHKGCINASMGSAVYGELCDALKQLIVINDLHLLYLCVPAHVVESIIPSWKTFFHQFSALSSDELKVAELYNIKMDVLINKYNGRTVKLSDGDNMIYIRMYVALMLHSIIKCTDSRGVWSVADRFDCPRGTMQSITLQCCTYASCLVHFTQELDVLWPLNALLPMIVRKLSHCVSIDLLPLMEIPGIKQVGCYGHWLLWLSVAMVTVTRVGPGNCSS
jgi:POLQ-like helicase